MRVIEIGMFARLRRLMLLGKAQGLIMAGEPKPFLPAHWLVSSASDEALAHEVTVLAAFRTLASCDCDGWEKAGCCKHVALVLKASGLGPWDPDRPEPPAEPIALPAAASTRFPTERAGLPSNESLGINAAWFRARLAGE